MLSQLRFRRLALHAVAVAVAIPVAGCGDSNDESAPARAASKPAKAALPGGRIVFRRYLDDAHTQGALFTINPDGSGEKQITDPSAGTIDDHPDWAPDGKRIAFQRCAPGQACQVLTVAARGGPTKTVEARCELSPVCDLSSPAWTPDGRLIVTSAEGAEQADPITGEPWIQQSSLVLLDLDRHTQRTIVKRGNWTGGAETPAVSPDGRTVLYMRVNSSRSRPHGARGMFVVGIDGSHERRVAPWRLGGGDHPGFAPDGTILFRSFEGDDSRQSDFWTVHRDGTRLRQLTHFEQGTLVLSASYSPDGRWIVHATNGVGDNADVVLMRADGTGKVPVTRTKLWDSAPDWGPVGS